MRLADAFEVVLCLARQNVIEDPDDEVLEVEQSRQEAAIAEVEKFAIDYDFNNGLPDDNETVHARVDMRGNTGPVSIWTALKSSDLEDGNGEYAIRRNLKKAGLNPNNVIGWSFYSVDEINNDPTLMAGKPILDEPLALAEEFDRLAPLGVTPQWREWYAERAAQIRKEAHEKDAAVADFTEAAFTDGFDGYGYGD